MRLFVDTSSLFKKYIDEPGSEDFAQLTLKASEIAVSPVTWIEVNNIVERRFRVGDLTLERAELLRTELKKDFAYFFVLTWNENLENKAVKLVRQHALKTMDAIQLASGLLSDSDIFVTSDRSLHLAAKKAIRHVRFI